MRRKDTGWSADALLEHADWVRRLASTLVQDPHLAEDVIQDTWIAALTRPGSAEADNQRAWLGTVVRNRVTRERRSRSRREARERRAARPEVVTDLERTSEYLELHRQLIALVNELDEDARTIVLLRYFDAIPPREIATRLGLSSAVVRKRLSRALQRLRQKLDQRWGGGRQAWSLALLGWLRQEGVRQGGPAASGTGSLVALTVLCAAVPLFFWTRSMADGRGVPAAQPDRALTAAARAPDLRDAGGALPGSAERETVPTLAQTPAPASARDWIEGRVVAPPGAPADDSLRVALVERTDGPEDLPAWIASKEDPEAMRHWILQGSWSERARAPVDSDGSFRLARPAETSAAWHLDVDGRFLYLEQPQPIALPPEGTAGPVYELHPRLGASVSGRLTAPEGTLKADFSGLLAVYHPQPASDYLSMAQARDSMHTLEPRADGSFELRGLCPGFALVLGVRPEAWIPAMHPIPPLAAGESRELSIALEPGVRVRGRTLDERGEPVVGADVIVVSTSSRRLFDHLEHIADKACRSDEQGVFEIAGIELGGAVLHAVCENHIGSHWISLVEEDVVEGILEVDVSLPRGSSLSGTVCWPDGLPAEGARVAVSVDRPEDDYWILGRGGETLCNALGEFEVRGLAPGLLGIRVQGTRASSRETDQGAAGELVGWAEVRESVPDQHLRLVLQPGFAIEGVVLDQSGAPLPYFELLVARALSDRLRGVATRAPRIHAFRDARGRFRVDDLPAGRWHLRARTAGFETSRALEVQTGTQNPVATQIRLGRARRLIGLVLDPLGEPVPHATVSVGDDRAIHLVNWEEYSPRHFRTQTDADGWFVLEGVPPTTVQIEAKHGAWAHNAPQRVDMASVDEELQIFVELRPACSVQGRLLSEESAPLSHWRIWASSSNGATHGTAVSDEDGGFELKNLAPGRWKLFALPNPTIMRDMGFDPDEPLDRASVGIGIEVELTADEERSVRMQRAGGTARNPPPTRKRPR